MPITALFVIGVPSISPNGLLILSMGTLSATALFTSVRRTNLADLPRAECLRRALEFDRLADISPTAEGAAFGFDQARLWRSRALVARGEAESSNEN